MQAHADDSLSARLLHATKSLESSFSAWSRGEATDVQVSDAYVHLGGAYLETRAVLERANITTADLIDVPQQLRQILEEALARPPSNDVVLLYGERLRNVMVHLFKQLKEKQTARTHSRQRSTASTSSAKLVHSDASAHVKPVPSKQAPKPPQAYVYPPPPRQSARPPNVPAPAPPQTSQAPVVATTALLSQQTPPLPQLASSLSQPPPQLVAPTQPPPQARVRRVPVSPSRENDALLKLQRHGALERQASKRYSTQQLSKIVNGSPVPSNFVPTTVVHRRSGVPDFRDTSVVARKDETRARRGSARRSAGSSDLDGEMLTAFDAAQADTTSVSSRSSASIVQGGESELLAVQADPEPEEDAPYAPEEESLTVFLRLGAMVRKASLPKPLSMAALRLSFVEVCEYVHSESGTFPPIETQDSASGILYELTEATMGDVSEGQLLTLKVRTPAELAVDEELRQIKDTLKQLTERVDGKRTLPSTPVPARVHSPVTVNTPFRKDEKREPPFGSTQSHIVPHSGSHPASNALSGPTVETVKREVAVIRQVANRAIGSMHQQIDSLRADLRNLSAASPASDRGFIATAKAQIDSEMKDMVGKMDDLSDIIDAQRVSVGQRGVRYPRHELEKVRKELSALKEQYERSQQFLNKEKPVWKKLWQQELSTVVEEQKWLKQADEVFTDISSDLQQTLDTFQLVCEANELPRPPNRGALLSAPPIKPGEQLAATNAMLEEISALNLNSDKRAEAVERAERVHKVKLALRSEEFVDELGAFVQDAKLRSNGGFEEVERKRAERERLARVEAEKSDLEAVKLNQKLKEERRAQRAKKITQAVHVVPDVASSTATEGNASTAASSTAPDTHSAAAAEETPDNVRTPIGEVPRPGIAASTSTSNSTSALSSESATSEPASRSASLTNEPLSDCPTSSGGSQSIAETPSSNISGLPSSTGAGSSGSVRSASSLSSNGSIESSSTLQPEPLPPSES